MNDDREAGLYVDTRARMGEPLFVGGFVEVCKLVWSMATGSRQSARVPTGDHTYEIAQAEHMQRENEGV
jgi:hypothetical protein